MLYWCICRYLSKRRRDVILSNAYDWPHSIARFNQNESILTAKKRICYTDGAIEISTMFPFISR